MALVAALVERGEVDSATAGQVVRGASVDAVGDLMGWTEGSFQFEPVEDAPQMLAGSPTRVDTLLAELDARDAEDGVPRLFLDDDAVVELSVPARSGQVVVASDAWALLSRLGGRRRLRELVDASGFGGNQVRRLLAPLVADGIVSVTPASAADDSGGTADRVLERIAHLEGAHPVDGVGWSSGDTSPPGGPDAAASAAPAPGVAGEAPADPVGGADESPASVPRYRPPPLVQPIGEVGDASPPSRHAPAHGQVGSSLRAALEDLEALNGFTEGGAPEPELDRPASGAPLTARGSASPEPLGRSAGEGPRPLGDDPSRQTTAGGRAATLPADEAVPGAPDPTGQRSSDADAGRSGDATHRLRLDPTIDQELLDKLIRHVEAL